MPKTLEKRLGRNYFAKKANAVAQGILGMYIVRVFSNGSTVRGRITETGAYEGGNTSESREGMLYAPGTIFLMPFRGHTSLNIATEDADIPSCVEIRAAEFMFGERIRKVETPYRLAKALGLDVNGRSKKNLDGIILGKILRIEGTPFREKIKKYTPKSRSGNCVAYYAIK